jgi:membrane protease YdiL (CAAX protease family)
MFSLPTPSPGPGPEELALPLTRLTPPSWLDAVIGYAPFKALVPIPILLLLAPLIWWFFKDTWQRLDLEAQVYRAGTPPGRDTYLRPAVCLCLVAVVLTLQEYYGGRLIYEQVIRPALLDLDAEQQPRWLNMAKYDELYGYCWWVFARVAGYVLIPLPLWKLLFPKDSLLDMGLRVRGFFSHIWIYALCLAIVAPAMLLVARQPDFGNYYPFYKQSSRSWYDFFAWEVIYFAQFFALELFFRGFMLGALRRTLGSAAIFVMAVPYCMIHYGKPYLEAHGAIVAGIVLGSLALRTRSIYAGFLVHISVALAMDLLALWRRAALPTTFWAAG